MRLTTSVILSTVAPAWMCAALQAQPPRQAGQQVGELVVQTVENPHADNTAFERMNQNVLVNPEVNKVMDDSNRKAASAVITNDSFCQRDYSRPCPDGWALQGKSICIAPGNYEGCEAIHDFTGASLALKQSFAVDCAAPFPCVDACAGGFNYNACPSGFIDSGFGFCKAGPGTSNVCSATVLNLPMMTVAEKQELAHACQIVFQCFSGCRRDFTFPCPEGWTFVSGVCVAPLSYSGPCEASIATSEMTPAQKQSFAEKCEVDYPCEGLHFAGDYAQSELDYYNGPVIA